MTVCTLSPASVGILAARLHGRHAHLILPAIAVLPSEEHGVVSGACQYMGIPGYRIVRTLGEGGMATVYLAVQENFDREVALKIMSPLLSRGDASFGERFLREARIVAKLSHPHIVTVYDVGLHEGEHYLAMEYVAGSDLKARRLELSLKQSLNAVKQVATALDFAHRKGYVHRDIKPENILLSEDGNRAVLTDFGIARPSGVEGGLTQTGTAIGTPSYMSPEQALGKPLDHRTDLYSHGVVLFYLLTGEVPFVADSAVAVGIKHAVDPIPRLPGAVGAFQAIIDKALAKSPDKRFQSGAEFADALDHEIANLTVERERAWRELVRSTRNKPTVAGATVISGANPTVTPTPTPSSVPTPISRPAPVARANSDANPAMYARADDRPGLRKAETKPAADRGGGLKWLLILVLAGIAAVGWLWLQRQPPVSTASVPDAAAAVKQPVAANTDASVPPPEGAAEPASSNGQPLDKPGELASTDTTPVDAPPVNTEAAPAGDTSPASTQSDNATEPAVAAAAPGVVADTETAEKSSAPVPTEAELRAAEIERLLGEAKQRLQAGKLIEPAGDNADAFYQEVLKREPKNAAARDGRLAVGAALAKQGLEASKRGDTPRANQLYEEAVVRAPKARDVQLLKQRLAQARQAEQAKPLLDKAKKLELAGALVQPAGNNAYDLYKQAQQIDPVSTLALRGLSEIEVKLADEIERLWKRGQVGDASALYAAAVQRYPDSDEILKVGKATVLANTRKPAAGTSDEEPVVTAPATTTPVTGAPGASQAAADLAKPEVLSLRASGNPINSLPSEQPTILVIGTSLHAAFTYQSFAAGTTVVKAELYDGSHQLKLAEKSLVVRNSAGEMRFQIDRQVDGYPDGGYYLDLTADGERLISLPFQVQRADLF